MANKHFRNIVVFTEVREDVETQKKSQLTFPNSFICIMSTDETRCQKRDTASDINTYTPAAKEKFCQ